MQVDVSKSRVCIVVERVQVVWCAVAAQTHVPVLMVEVDSSCMSMSYTVDDSLLMCQFRYSSLSLHQHRFSFRQSECKTGMLVR